VSKYYRVMIAALPATATLACRRRPVPTRRPGGPQARIVTRATALTTGVTTAWRPRDDGVATGGRPRDERRDERRRGALP